MRKDHFLNPLPIFQRIHNKLQSQKLPSTYDSIKSLERIIEIFNNPIEIGVIITRYEGIKMLQNESEI